MTRTMELREFNALPAAEAAAVAAVWAAVPAWTDALVAGRPWADVAALASAASRLAASWTQDDLDAALAHHPRIGDRVAAAGANADHSRREQAAMSEADAATAARMAAGNAAYEERFGRVFLVRAAGRSPEQLLAELERRLGNDPDTEWREAAGALAEIALLRLAATVSDDVEPAHETDREVA